MLENIIMNLFTDITTTKNDFSDDVFIFQNPGLYNLLVHMISIGLFKEKRISDTKKKFTSFH